MSSLLNRAKNNQFEENTNVIRNHTADRPDFDADRRNTQLAA